MSPLPAPLSYGPQKCFTDQNCAVSIDLQRPERSGRGRVADRSGSGVEFTTIGPLLGLIFPGPGDAPLLVGQTVFRLKGLWASMDPPAIGIIDFLPCSTALIAGATSFGAA